MKRGTYLFLSVFIFFSCSKYEKLNVESIKVEGGVISGMYHPTSEIMSFKGIPFAAPPVGELRWKAPQPVIPWDGVKKCETFGASPFQAKPAPFMFWSSEFLIPAEPISEDCLYLNVWTKAKQKDEKLPVLVYIYGGGFRSGGAGCAIYDGENMAKKGVVFVSINYRVGVFGFLAHPGLTKESEHAVSGNYALLDMIAALEWVKKNIREFGGDPDNVTIAGQSAGSFAVNYLTVSPLAKGLFHKAIAESGAGFLTSPLRPNLDLSGAEQIGIEFGEKLDASTITELRAKTPEEILNAQSGLSGPFTDGYVLSESISNAYLSGHQNNVPVIIGWNKDDRVSGPPVSAKDFKERINKRFGEKAIDFFAVYPAETEDEAAQSQYDMSRDETFGAQMYTWAKVQNSVNGAPVYMYNFNRNVPSYTPETAFGAFHSGEIVYAYDNLHTLDRPWEPIDHEIADIMSDFWINFAKTGNPNGDGLPHWDAYTDKNELTMTFDVTTEQKQLPDKEKLNFWIKYFDALK